MTKTTKTSEDFQLLADACAEIKIYLNENKHELSSGRIEQLKKNAAKISSSEAQTPDLKKQLAEFNALYKQYTSQVHCLYEARDLDRWEHYTLKIDLCRDVKKLAEGADSDLPRIARELKLIRLHWKDIGSVPHEKNDEIWHDFCEECSKLQKRIGEYYDGLEEHRHEIAIEKIKICEEAEAVQSSSAWEDGAQTLKDLQKRWREVGFTAPNQEKELYMRFRKACDIFFDARKEHYHQAKFKEDKLSSVKFKLCEEAKTIFDLSYSDAHQLIPNLWNRWKAAGSAGKNDRELYERFRAYFDTYYDGLRKQRNGNLKIKKKLCDELEALDKDLESGKKQFEDIKSKYLKIKKHWDATGDMPRSEEQSIIEKHASLSKKLDALALESQCNSKNILKRSFKLEKIVSAALDSLNSKKIEIWEKCQADWKAAEDTEKKYFSNSFDAISAAFEDGSDEHYEKLLNIFKDKLKERKKICKELENLGIKPKKEVADEDLAKELTMAIIHNFGNGSSENDSESKTEKINQTVTRWLKVGIVPLKDLPQLYKRFEQAIENI